jgi:cellulose synthase/poly-beta-1,6-N-acetylglucosamine synthase-like glycosyltransferase
VFLIKFLLGSLYVLAMLFILMYGLIQAHLLLSYLKRRRVQSHQPISNYPSLTYPKVTIQLPIYNEAYVVEELIDAVCAIEYPEDMLDIQVLDDSSDLTTQILLEKVKHWQGKGKHIDLIRRPDREGFKAGALKYGLEQSQGEFIAIFDADFRPEKSFLQQTIPYFEDPKIGVVQTRWQHINRNESILTQIQSLALDTHFSIEQSGRNELGAFINFNGTAGVWRKTCILDAGNWTADTLTEDLDLSYRAQLKGWQFIYKESVGSPAELPSIMSAIKSQQYRWNKGGAEVARKTIIPILRSPFPWYIKIHGILHLLNSSIFVAILIAGLVGVAMIPVLQDVPIHTTLGYSGFAFIVMTAIIAINYGLAHRQYAQRTFLNYLLTFPLFLCISMGLAWHNGVAVIEGLVGKQTPFIRTPKKGSKMHQPSRYLNKELPWGALIEIGLAILFASAVWMGLALGVYNFLLFHIMLFIGFMTIGGLTLWHHIYPDKG